MHRIYNIGIHLYAYAIRVVSLVNTKAKLWVKGRKHSFESLASHCKPNDKIIWFHCASLGEFEQGRTLIELIKKNKPDYKILLSFFSPSGYEIRKNYPMADLVCYLPHDTPHNVKRFFSIVHPEYIFFIKYEFWFNYIQEAYKRNIPLYYVSAIFREKQWLFSFYAKWYRKQLSKASYFFTQNETSKLLLNRIGIHQCEVYGDTRFDTVAALSKQSDPIIERFSANKPLMIAGSTWLEDEKILSKVIHSYDYKWIIVPHEIGDKHLTQMRELFAKFACLFYTKITSDTDITDSKVLIIDKIGILRYLYHYASMAYIGGGFGKGIHNTLEAATYGLPVIFGPNYKRFQEACDLIDRQAAFSIQEAKDLNLILHKLLHDNTFYKEASKEAKDYVNTRKGSSEKIFSFVFKK